MTITSRAARAVLPPKARRLLASHAPAAASTWTRPIPPGREPAYDEALAFLAEHQARLRQEIRELKEKLNQTTDQATRQDIEAQMKSTEIASEINDPAVRHAFQSGNAPLSRPVFRHLYALSWRNGQQAQLLSRLRDMSVVPDVLPSLTPTVHLRLAFGQGLGFDDTQNKQSRGGNVATAAWVPTRFSMKAPQVIATPLHTEERLYTLALVDADVPDVPKQRLSTWCHWLVKDIPLSATQNDITSSSGSTWLSYIAPHPAQGSPTRRLVLVLLEQSPSNHVATPAEQTVAREHFSLAAYAQKTQATPAGAAFWRSKWTVEDSHAISGVWAKERPEEREPKFGKIPKMDRYVQDGVKSNRYF